MKKRIAALAIVLFYTCLSMPVNAAGSSTPQEAQEADAAGSYEVFLSQQAYEPASGDAFCPEIVKTGENEWQWTAQASAAGRYWIKVRYRAHADAVRTMEGRITVNGRLPYAELDGFALPIEYIDESKPRIDTQGNEIRPVQVPSARGSETLLFDYAGLYAEPLSVNLEPGTNTIVLTLTVGEAEVEALTLLPATVPSYQDVQSGYAALGLTEYQGEPVHQEAERSLAKSDSTLYPLSDQSSPLVSPVSSDRILLNTIGGYRWQTVGQYIEWSVDAPEEGLYALSFKVRQNVTNGQKSSRILLINGEIPFREAMTLTVPFSANWQVLTPGDGRADYLFHLHKGLNTVRLQATLGEMDQNVRRLESSVHKLNELYRKLLIILGPAPDLARDYKLDKLVPEQMKQMGQQADVLAACADRIEELNEGSNAGVGLIRTMVRQLRGFTDDSDNIAKGFSYFKTNIGALGTWLTTARQQPLEIDYLEIGRAEDTADEVNAGFFSQLCFQIRVFIASFTTDYRRIGNYQRSQDERSDQELRVWIAGGRDQAQTIRSMISDSFTPEQGICVQLELVNVGALLPAVVAGIGPDVNIGGADIINFAMRGAAYDLQGFADFDKVKERFNDTLFVPMRYQGGTFGLPEAISFSVMFYRTDIFAELAVEAPETWENLIALSSVLAKNNMMIGLPAGSASYLMMVRQRGLEIYRDDGAACVLDRASAIEAMRAYTNFYTNYGLPLSYDLVNRFRSGEMPVAIADFSIYNNLQVAAPEIKGLWKFALVPGTTDDNGHVDHTTLASSTASMLLAKAGSPQRGWEFLKWWTSAEAQIRYAREIESLLGPSARYSSANEEAFQQSSWPRDSLALLEQQKLSLSAVEQVPGSYFLTRHLDNAFRNIVYRGEKPMDMMFDYVYKINAELTDKRREFGLNTVE